MSLTEQVPVAGGVHIGSSAAAAGRAAGERAATALREVLRRKSRARVIFASAPSQDACVRTLAAAPDIDWSRVQSMHLDEYRGIEEANPAAFGQWLADRLPAPAQAGLDRISPHGTSDDEVSRYTDLLTAGPIDLICLGIGVNGHIAFNEPGDTDFRSTILVREVALTHASRKQQVDEGLFPGLDEVPTHALSLTVPAILRGDALVVTVLGPAKAASVASALTGPVTPDLPASALRTHQDVAVFLDEHAAAALPADLRTSRIENG
ncbi:6-phosphogluconolactonase [Ruania zhangjianzhongii]|uniref:6-phosphogluconolactonase n=1 Tax=Ruania zhangjianzhongii TaxID=2603206 RepID=UPI0011C7E045|nr:6-phosphogluconolactonase [Ruania zhangjianzhongii]